MFCSVLICVPLYVHSVTGECDTWCYLLLHIGAGFLERACIAILKAATHTRRHLAQLWCTLSKIPGYTIIASGVLTLIVIEATTRGAQLGRLERVLLLMVGILTIVEVIGVCLRAAWIVCLAQHGLEIERCILGALADYRGLAMEY